MLILQPPVLSGRHAELPTAPIESIPQPHDDAAEPQRVLARLEGHAQQQSQWRLDELPEPMRELLTDVVRQHLPEQYTDDRHWGKTKVRWDGLKVHRDGLKISTKRRWKEVNHGTWRRYTLRLIEPEKNVQLWLRNVHSPAPGVLAFDAILDAKIDGQARLSRWRYGVQMISLSVEADADVRMRISGELTTRLDPRHVPPDLLLVPTIKTASIQLQDFRVHRVSKLDGPIVRELAEELDGVLQDKLDDQRTKIVDRMNRSLARHQDKFRVSVYEALLDVWPTRHDGG